MMRQNRQSSAISALVISVARGRRRRRRRPPSRSEASCRRATQAATPRLRAPPPPPSRSHPRAPTVARASAAKVGSTRRRERRAAGVEQNAQFVGADARSPQASYREASSEAMRRRTARARRNHSRADLRAETPALAARRHARRTTKVEPPASSSDSELRRFLREPQHAIAIRRSAREDESRSAARPSSTRSIIDVDRTAPERRDRARTNASRAVDEAHLVADLEAFDARVVRRGLVELDRRARRDRVARRRTWLRRAIVALHHASS